MPKPEGCEWAIFYDSVHIVTVNYAKGEARLFENAGSTEGQLLFAKDDSVAKLPIGDPFQLISLALTFAIRYELIAKVAEEEALQVLEKLEIKALLDRVQNLTTEQNRHQQLQGLGLKLAAKPNGGDKKRATKPQPQAVAAQSVPEVPATASAATG